MNVPNEAIALSLIVGIPVLAGTVAANLITRRQRRNLTRELAPNRQLFLMPPAQEQRLLTAPESEARP